MRTICSWLAIFCSILLTSCGGISQDDLRRNALSNDDDDEIVAPVAATESEPSAAIAVAAAPVPALSQPPATNVTTSGITTPQKQANQPPKTSAKSPNSPAPTSESKAVSAAESSATPFDLADDFATAPTQVAPATEFPEAELALELERLGPSPVVGDEPTFAQLEALREWNEKRSQIATEMVALAEAKELKQMQVSQQNASAVAGRTDAKRESYNDGPNNRAEILQALFARLTDPGKLAPEELGRVAQELAYDGTTKEALAYHHGWALTTENLDELKEQVSWVPALQRPASALHWGLGVEYSGAPQLVDKANPIGKDNRAFDSANRERQSVHLKNYVGELGDRLLMGLDERIEQGLQGNLLKPPVDKEERQRTVKLQWQNKPVGFNPEPLGRGITLLGGGTRKELVHIAKLEGIDVLVIYEMNVKQPRSGQVVNITTLKLIDMWHSKEMCETPPLNNVKVQQARWDRSQKDPVDTIFEDLFAEIDESLRFSPLPKELKEEHARTRIETLAASQPANPLAAMAEMRLYHAQGLVGDATLYAGYKALIGDAPAKKLVTGSPAERVAAIGPYLPKVLPVK